MLSTAPSFTTIDPATLATLEKIKAIKVENVPVHSDAQVEALWSKMLHDEPQEFELDPNNGLQAGFLTTMIMNTLKKFISLPDLAKNVLSFLPGGIKDQVMNLLFGESTMDAKLQLANLIKDTVNSVISNYLGAGGAGMVLNMLVPMVVDLLFQTKGH